MASVCTCESLSWSSFLSFSVVELCGVRSPLRHSARPSEKGSCLEQGWGCGKLWSLRSLSEFKQLEALVGFQWALGVGGGGCAQRARDTWGK